MSTYGTVVAKPATIANGASLSDAIDLGPFSLVGIATAAAWSTAEITFQVSPDDGVTWLDYETVAGVEVVIASTAASKYRGISPGDFAGVRHLKVRSGTSAAPVNQAGGDTVSLMLRSL